MTVNGFVPRNDGGVGAHIWSETMAVRSGHFTVWTLSTVNLDIFLVDDYLLKACVEFV